MIVQQILTRFYVEDMDQAILFYERLHREHCIMRIKVAGIDLEVARVGSMLLFKGKEEIVKEQKRIAATYIVDSIEQFKESLIENGAEMMEEPRIVPAGMSMRIKHPDQNEIEYVQLI